MSSSRGRGDVRDNSCKEGQDRASLLGPVDGASEGHEDVDMWGTA